MLSRLRFFFFFFSSSGAGGGGGGGRLLQLPNKRKREALPSPNINTYAYVNSPHFLLIFLIVPVKRVCLNIKTFHLW